VVFHISIISCLAPIAYNLLPSILSGTPPTYDVRMMYIVKVGSSCISLSLSLPKSIENLALLPMKTSSTSGQRHLAIVIEKK